jgi:hypothetical protein
LKLNDLEDIIQDKVPKKGEEAQLTSFYAFLILNGLHLLIAYFEGLSSQLFLHVQAPFLLCKPRIEMFVLIFLFQIVHAYLNYSPMILFNLLLLITVYKYKHLRERIFPITISLVVALIKTVMVKQDI